MANGHIRRVSTRWGLLLLITLLSCSATKPQNNTPPVVEAGISLTPPAHYTTYYSTQKARALGESYNENLDRLLERLTQSPIGKMQFSNAIVSLSLGFFTHSASRPPDERYLEVILGIPDILEAETDVNITVSRLFSQYGREILSILASDTTIAEDQKVAGYGLNFSWRNMLRTPSGPRMTMQEAVIYIPKKKAERFLKQQIDDDELLGTSTLFVRQGENPSQQIRYVPPPSQPGLPSPSLSTQPADLQAQEKEKGGNATPSPKQPEQNPPSNKPPLKTTRRAPSTPSVQQVAQGDSLFDPPANIPTNPILTTFTFPPEETLPLSSPDGGYLVQLSFPELIEAKGWEDLLKERGYITSLGASKEDRSLHLRIGNFVSTAAASKFLDYFKTQGLQGLILQNSK